jgi:tetratricopeptide (TPR) repeat protein
MYRGRPEQAMTELQKMADRARNDGELRTAYFGMAVVSADTGKLDRSLAAMDKEYAIAEKKNDAAAMAADLQAKGNILLEVPNYDEARRQFDHSFQIIQESDLSRDVKDNAALLHHFNLTVLAIAKNDYAAAKTHSEEFQRGAEASKNAVQLKQFHELAGRIAFAEKNYDKAIAELAESNQQNPANLYRLALAYQGKGDTAKAQDYASKAATFNSLPQLNYAFIRVKAGKMARNKKSS